MLADIPEEDRSRQLKVFEDKELIAHSSSTLGVHWDPSSDVYKFTAPSFMTKMEEEKVSSLTKRKILKRVASIFDPLGLVSPFTVRASVLLQQLWALTLDWDTPIASVKEGKEILQSWEKWQSELPKLEEVEFPRCLVEKKSKPVKRENHVFSDASNEAYCAALYRRTEYENGEVTCRLVIAKTRVTPMKKRPITQLELMGAVLGVRLAVQHGYMVDDDEVRHEIPTHHWCDSTTVLHWISKPGKSLKEFVGNRVGEIQETTTPEAWHHVRSQMNPADLASRGMSITELQESKL